MKLHSPAKLNLSLAVLGRRGDGFHELDTILVALDRLDVVEVAREDPRSGPPGEVAIRGPFASPDVPRDATNLARRAVDAVLAHARQDRVVTLALEKHVPSRAGLGGGSANAAVAALGALRLLNLPGGDWVLDLLNDLGSDCGFFFAARETGLARCTGRGEVVEPCALPVTERVFAVVTPDVFCGTGDVYRAWRPRGPSRAPLEDPSIFFEAPLAEARAVLRNDLEAAALRSHPALGPWRELLDAVGGGHFRLAGSGSSFFGLFDERAAAEAFLRELEAARKARDHGLRAAFVARPWTAREAAAQ